MGTSSGATRYGAWDSLHAYLRQAVKCLLFFIGNGARFGGLIY